MAGGFFAKYFQHVQSQGKEKNVHEPVALDIRKAMLGSGRVEFSLLASWANKHEKDAFIRMIPMPFLVGSSVVKGNLFTLTHQEMTKFFEEEKIAARSDQEEQVMLEWALYPLIKKQDTFGTGIEKLTIGRDSDSDIVIPDYAISKKHAEIRVVHKDCFIKDRGAKNKIYINGVLLSSNSESVLKNGDLLKLGRYKFYLMSSQALYDIFNAEI
ncbi:MAG: FHA domain-containing protein [Magnetococcus sp. DMHC-1]|nr:FHA domain-containing protein [Magnetococcales bacterium]MBF0154349.1 FHA domain-containing protein [Magnetococcales bacterium]